jgi:hypothetical protein
MRSAILIIAALAAPAAADDYCDHARAVAASEADLLAAPELFVTAGYTQQPAILFGEVATTAQPRVIAGVQLGIMRIAAGNATRGRADAECHRHAAVDRIAHGPTGRALAAQISVLDGALVEGEAMVAKLATEVDQQLTTRPELIAARLRLDELRALAAEAHRQLATQPRSDAPLVGALAEQRAAVEDLEHHEGRLRTLSAFDVSVRAGIDRSLDHPTDTPYLATLSITVNTGLVFQHGANSQAASARRRLARADEAELSAQATTDTQRAAQLAELIAQLEDDSTALARLSGDDARRLRRSLWFDLVQRKADRAFLVARVSATRELAR